MPTSPPKKEVFDLFIILTPIIMAVFAWYISFIQSKVSREKLRLDLYNKRFGVYEAALNFNIALNKYSGPLDEEYKSKHIAFIKASREAQFLFSQDSKIFGILEKMNTDVFMITSVKDRQGSYSTFSDQDRTGYDLMLKKTAEFDSHIFSLGEAMAPYLNFHKIVI